MKNSVPFISIFPHNENELAMASIFKIVKKINILIDSKKIDPEGASKVIEMFHHIDSVLKIFSFEDESQVFNDKVERLIKEREQARKEKNFKQADKIRDELKDLGITIQDDKLS